MPGTVELPSIMQRATGTKISPLAGRPAPKEMLLNVARLENEYFTCRPDLTDASSL